MNETHSTVAEHKPAIAQGQTSKSTTAIETAPLASELSPAKSLAPKRWSAETWSIVITAVCTLLTLIAAVLLGLHGMKTAEATVETMTTNLRQSNLLTIYNLNLETSRFFEANPKLVKLFDKSYRKSMTDQQLMEAFDKLDEDQQTLARLGCEKIADFMQVTFLQRTLLPANDWDNWWSYICDQYDESPLLRNYLSKRSAWYSYLEAIKADNRSKYYRGTARK